MPRSATSGGADAAVHAALVEVVAEKTGYPAEVLEPGMQLDADLGIDSIKRVEILAAHPGPTARQPRSSARSTSAPSAPSGRSPTSSPGIADHADAAGGDLRRGDARGACGVGRRWSARRPATPPRSSNPACSSTPTWASTRSSGSRSSPRIQERLPASPGHRPGAPRHHPHPRPDRRLPRRSAGQSAAASSPSAAGRSPDRWPREPPVRRLIPTPVALDDRAGRRAPRRSMATSGSATMGRPLAAAVRELGWGRSGTVSTSDQLRRSLDRAPTGSPAGPVRPCEPAGAGNLDAFRLLRPRPPARQGGTLRLGVRER